jgi:phosphoribosyl-ATP pyrophosphohydrolase
MVFERYYIDLLDLMNSSFKKIAYSERLFELSKTGKYPALFSEMAESFAMMMVKVEARDFHLKQVIEELEKIKTS